MIDEDGEKFLDCISDEEDVYQPKADSASIHEDPTVDNDNDPKAKKLFKLKDTKSKVVYDHNTKQKRFMSPFE